jgi:hypothetical protein
LIGYRDAPVADVGKCHDNLAKLAADLKLPAANAKALVDV